MMPLVLLALLLTDIPPHSKAKVTEAVVVLEDRSITLPPLPLDVGQGRKHFQEVHAQLKTAEQDLTAALRALYSRPEASSLLPPDLEVPASFAAEGAELVGILDDRAYSALEFTFSEVWKGWQAALTETGLGRPLPASGGKPIVPSKAYEEARKKAKQILSEPSRQQPARETRLDSSFNEENAELFPDTTTYREPNSSFTMSAEELAIHRRVEKFSTDTQKIWAATNILIPSLAETWNPLVDHLNGRARRLANMGKRLLNSTLLILHGPG